MITLTKAGKMKQRKNKAFTLVEIIIALSLTCLLVAGIMSSLGWIFRTQYSLANYCQMDKEARVALELVGRDIKQFQPADSTYPLAFSSSSLGGASEVQSFSCAVPSPSNINQSVKVTYIFRKKDSGNGNLGTFSRVSTNPDNSTSTQVLVKNVASFTLSGSGLVDSTGNALSYPNITALAGASNSIKQLQIKLTTQVNQMMAKTAGQSSQQLTSAQFSIRRKK